MRKKLHLFLAMALLVSGGILVRSTSFPFTEKGTSLGTLCFSPSFFPRNRPFVLIVPAGNSMTGREFRFMARQLGRGGMVTLILSPSLVKKAGLTGSRIGVQEMEKIISEMEKEYLRALPSPGHSKPEEEGVRYRIGLVGHSMGANVAFSLALASPASGGPPALRDGVSFRRQGGEGRQAWGVGRMRPTGGVRYQVRAVASLGMALFASPDLPPNLLLAAGLYDQAHSWGRMYRAMAESSGIPLQPAPPQGGGNPACGGPAFGRPTFGGIYEIFEICDLLEGKRYGEFLDGTARKLFLSPYSSHLTELLDPLILRELSVWMQHCFYGGVLYNPFPFETWRGIGITLVVTGGVWLFLALFQPARSFLIVLLNSAGLTSSAGGILLLLLVSYFFSHLLLQIPYYLFHFSSLVRFPIFVLLEPLLYLSLLLQRREMMVLMALFLLLLGAVRTGLSRHRKAEGRQAPGGTLLSAGTGKSRLSASVVVRGGILIFLLLTAAMFWIPLLKQEAFESDLLDQLLSFFFRSIVVPASLFFLLLKIRRREVHQGKRS